MKAVQDNCGIFAIYGPGPCAWEIFQGIDFLQHRGQQYCGIATYDDGVHQVTHHGKVLNTFTDQELDSLPGRWGIGHVSLKERQPVKWQSSLGEIAVAFSGNLINAKALKDDMMSRGKAFWRGYHVEIIAKLILEEKDPVSGIAGLAEKIIGAYSLVVLTREGIYAARDLFGLRPLILGHGPGRYIVCSESRALHNLGFEIVRDVRPGEIVLLDHRGCTTVRQLPSPRSAHCAFEWAYTASLDSVIDGLPVLQARYNLGARLSQRDQEEGGVQADLVAAVPMSGIAHAIGYHMHSRLNYQEVFLYNRYADRSYTQATQVAREKMAKRKLAVLQHAVKGKSIILCDDSIVRGTQIYNKVHELKQAGARAVHVRVACPPLMYPCDFGISTRTYEELMARKYLFRGDIITLEQLRDLEGWVAAHIGADSVKYNSLEAFVAALQLSRDDLCLKCWDGKRPMGD
ncbi:MAG: amidophosphoribosyltransferase [Deltaproteobacteria bacterium]|nr:amidophosphoribosyltransferase [Deltaproteobacteria bacterium]